METPPGTLEHVYLAAPPPGTRALGRWGTALALERDMGEADGWRLARCPRTIHVGGAARSTPEPELPARARQALEDHPAVWRGEPHLGLGPGAHSFDGSRRLWNLRDRDAYFSRIGRGEDPAAGRERPDAGQRFLERSWSGLRPSEGIPLSALPRAALEIRDRWIAQGWAHPDPHRLRLTRRRWLLLGGLAVELASAGPVDAGSGSRRSSEAP